MPAQAFQAQALVNKVEDTRRRNCVTVFSAGHTIDSPLTHVSVGQCTKGWPRINFPLSTSMLLSSRKRAVLIGISYFGTRGQLPDSNVHGLACLLNQNYGFRKEDIVMLTDVQQRPTSQPTKKQILLSMHWLVKAARPGDHLLFYYCGHGDLRKALVPLDFRTHGFIEMSDMQDIMTAQQVPGVLMTIIVDWYGHESSMQTWYGMEHSAAL